MIERTAVLLRDALEVSGLSQRELAARCEIHESHVCRILTGKAQASKRLYRDLLIELYEALEEPPLQPWRVRIRRLRCATGLTPVQVQYLVAQHHGCALGRFPHFINIGKALHRKGLLQSDDRGWGNYLTPAAYALIQRWTANDIYDEILAEVMGRCSTYPYSLDIAATRAVKRRG